MNIRDRLSEKDMILCLRERLRCELLGIDLEDVRVIDTGK